MSVYLVLGLLLVATCQITALPEELEKLAAILHKQCVTETNVREDAITDARLGIFAKDPELKCYMKCLMVLSSIMDEEGRINGGTLMDMVPKPFKDIVRPIVEKCVLLDSSDLCEKAYIVNVCFQTEGPAYYYIA